MHQQALYNHQNMFPNMPTSPTMYSSKPNGPPIEDLFDTIKNNAASVNNSMYQDQSLVYSNNNSAMQNSYNMNMSLHNQQNLSLVTPWQDHCNEFDEHWVTVFGFPPNAANTILARFSDCGAILGNV